MKAITQLTYPTLALLALACFALSSPTTALGDEPENNPTNSDNALTSWSWRATGSLNTARHDHTATLLQNGMVLVAGGLDNHSGASASAELYDPASRTWSATGSLNTARGIYTAKLLPNGMVLVV